MDQTIPATWRPGQNCLPSTDLWEWKGLGTTAYVLGGPVETSSCYPPGYTAVTSTNYQATACPIGFSQACVNADLTTCCPTRYSFACNTDTAYAYLGSTTFPCTSQWPTEGLNTTTTFTYTQLGSRAQALQSYTVTRVSDSSTITFATSGWFTTTEVVSDGATLHAMAVAISQPTQATTTSNTNGTRGYHSASPTPTSPVSNQTGAGGLSSGAAAGIGVGVAVGILLLAAAVFIFYRHRRKVRQLPSTAGQLPQDLGAPQVQDIHRKPDSPQPIEMGVYERPRELPT